nr:immunoglobulin light chain junction region [Macaca mulatta]
HYYCCSYTTRGTFVF